jgi:hypothetical protein
MRNDLMELEQQVEKLIQLVERLDQENRHLRKQQGGSQTEPCPAAEAA